MMPHPARLSAVALPLVLGAFPALADVTPRQVWDSWQSAYGAMDMTMSPAAERTENGTLTLTDVALSLSEDDVSVTGTIPEIRLRDLGDGTVEITMSPGYELAFAMTPPEGDSLTGDMTLTLPDLRTIASGTPEAIGYDVTAPTFGLKASGTGSDGSVMDIAVTFDGMTARYVLDGAADDAAQTFTYDLVADRMEQEIVVVPGPAPEGAPASSGTMNLAAASEGLRVEGAGKTASLSVQPGPADDDGLSATGSVGASVFTLGVVDEETGQFLVNGSLDDGSIDYARRGPIMDYSAVNNGLEVEVSGDNVPLPDLTAAIATLAVALKIPVRQTEAPEAFAMNLALDGVSISDTLWGMIDPGGALPRDPARLVIDLAGKARLLADLADPAAATPGQAPGELHALDISRLNLAIAGADLTGSGAFTFDNADMTTFEGFPAPDGDVTLQLTGGNALLDKLVQMGLVPQDQAMGARMMMGLFATPSGDDTLTTKIEVRPDGSVSANGQRLK